MSFGIAVIDTTVWIDYLRAVSNPETDWLDHQFGVRRLGLTDISFCEVLQGVSDEKQARSLEKKLRAFEIFNAGGPEVARDAARHDRALGARGRTVRKTIDGLIAAFCIREELALLHRDRDFDPFEQYLGLAVIHP
ncbi:MAG TPA: PIN domain nuclease [Vicinamibacterales bacterium]|jgi:hypothetical protein